MAGARLTAAGVFTLGLGLVVAAVVAASALAAPGQPSAAEQRRVDQLARVNFVSTCRFSHASNDDPIVFPGQAGRSHHHSFVGNRTTNAASTYASLRAAGSSCERDGHTAAYWMPSLVVDGTPLAPAAATVYYRRKSLDRIRAFPADFRMIAGDALATSPQGLRVTFWSCGVAAGVAPSTTPPACPPGRASALRLHVRFPSCWDGRSLDSADHRSHMRYGSRGGCPATHPVAVPEITLIFRYPQVAAGAALSLASGGVLSAHADFVNAWEQRSLVRLVARCLTAMRHCARGD